MWAMFGVQKKEKQRMDSKTNGGNQRKQKWKNGNTNIQQRKHKTPNRNSKNKRQKRQKLKNRRKLTRHMLNTIDQLRDDKLI